jgi:general secretion pathway protein M
MMPDHPIDRVLARYPYLAVIGYAAIVVVFVAVTWSSIAGVFERRATIASASALLSQIEGRGRPPVGAPGSPAGPVPTGSPFLEGQTVTIAGAALLQRVAGAATRLGGNVLSSQVDLHGTQSKDGFVSLIASCEVTWPAFQELLYDLEAGMPFLFIDQLVAQAPAASAGAPDAKLRILLTVSGQWQNGK